MRTTRLLGQLGPFVILAADAAWLWSRWDQIPARIAVHYDIAGRPNGWADKTPLHVFGLLLFSAILALLLLLANAAASGQAANRRLTARILLAAAYFEAVTNAVILLPLAGAPVAVVMIPLPLALIFVAAIIVMSRRAQPIPDEAWKGGLFYANPDDTALFVPKRTGIGYTLNFSNPWSWLVIAALVAFPVVLALVVPRLVR